MSEIKTRPVTKEYADNFDRIFRRNKEQCPETVNSPPAGELNKKSNEKCDSAENGYTGAQ